MVDRLLKKLKKRIKRNKSDIDLIRSALLEIQRKEARSQQDLKDYQYILPQLQVSKLA